MSGPASYITEPPTRGKVVLRTSFGDIDVELWPQQAPLACRNLVQLALEGYYDNSIFHRVIKDMVVQTGAGPDGASEGETVFGVPFKDEPHQRLKFNHRGQVAMANANVPNSNGCQFFITLGNKLEWLDKKHTIFGKVTGNTVFNLLRMGDCETDKDDRPLEPPRLLSVEVLDNPFDDIVPRTAARALAAKAVAQQADESARAARAVRAVRASNLLSFVGDDEDDDGGGSAGSGRPAAAAAAAAAQPRRSALGGVAAAGAAEVPGRAQLSAFEASADDSGALAEAAARRGLKRPAAAAADGAAAAPSGSPAAGASALAAAAPRDKRARYPAGGAEGAGAAHGDGAPAGGGGAHASEGTPVGLATVAAPSGAAGPAAASKPAATAAAAITATSEFARLRSELLASRRGAVAVLTGAAASAASAAAADDSLLTPLQLMRSRYARRGDGASKARESSTMDKLAAFQAAIKAAQRAAPSAAAAAAAAPASAYHGQVLEEEADVDEGGSGAAAAAAAPSAAPSWMAHKLKFIKHLDDKLRAGTEDDGLITIDDSAPLGGTGDRGRPTGGRERGGGGGPGRGAGR